MYSKDYKIYREKAFEIIQAIKSEGYKVTITDYSDKECPQMTFRIKGIRRVFGIIAVGEWSNYYMINEKIDGIAIFSIHDWKLDRFRYYESDWRFTIGQDSTDFSSILSGIKYLKKNPISSYTGSDISIISKYKKYFSNWWYYEVVYPFNTWNDSTGSSLLLWNVLKVISYFDPCVTRREIVEDNKDFYPRFTFSFLCKENISDEQCYRVWKWYSYNPRKLSRWCYKKLSMSIFNARYNVADCEPGLDESEIKLRMIKGIYYE